jgi:hypothetical protein
VHTSVPLSVTPHEFEELTILGVLPQGEAGEVVADSPVVATPSKPSVAVRVFLAFLEFAGIVFRTRVAVAKRIFDKRRGHL